MGKFFVIVLLLTTVVAGGVMYYFQVYGFYAPVALASESDAKNAADIRLTSLISGLPEHILVENFQGIDATSSPLRFRACFTTLQSIAMLTETYVTYETAVPLTGPKWFDCYDAAAIGEDLATGSAFGFLSEANITYGIDRVIAVYDDGRGYVWHQINRCGEQVFDGKPAPQECPAAPERSQ